LLHGLRIKELTDRAYTTCQIFCFQVLHSCLEACVSMTDSSTIPFILQVALAHRQMLHYPLLHIIINADLVFFANSKRIYMKHRPM